MKKFLICAAILYSRVAFATCDCLIIPFPDSCAKECMGKLLSMADYGQLHKSIGLSESLSHKIFNFPQKDRVKSIDAYSEILNMDEMQEVTNKLNKIDSKTAAAIINDRETKSNPQSHR